MPIKTFSQKFNRRILSVILLSSLTAAAALIAADGATQEAEQEHAGHAQAAAPAKLVELVRDASNSSTLTQPQPPVTSHSLPASAARITGRWAITT